MDAAPREAGGAGGTVAAAWAFLGVGLLFAFAVFRLGRRGLETVAAGLTPLEWGALVLLTLGFVLMEGRGALQLRWVPRLGRRVRALREGGSWPHRVLAPLYGMSLVGAPASTLLKAWGGTGAIVTAILVVRSFPQPWRGIVDLAVAAALLWGLAALAAEGRRVLR